jgi:hypothetical protein
MSPSHWSQAALLLEDKLIEVPLDSIFGFPPSSNGLCSSSIAKYDDPTNFPNVAMLGITADVNEVQAATDKLRLQRGQIDLVEHIVVWLAYSWGAGKSSNPLLEGFGVPSAVFVEMVIGNAGIDLTPGIPSRTACPEAFWQAARWWADYYKSVEDETGAPLFGTGLSGRWHVGHRLP